MKKKQKFNVSTKIKLQISKKEKEEHAVLFLRVLSRFIGFDAVSEIIFHGLCLRIFFFLKK